MPSTVLSALQAAFPLQDVRPEGLKNEAKPAFIAWPEDHASLRAQDVVVDMPADVLFEELWGTEARVAVRRSNPQTLLIILYGLQCQLQSGCFSDAFDNVRLRRHFVGLELGQKNMLRRSGCQTKKKQSQSF